MKVVTIPLLALVLTPGANLDAAEPDLVVLPATIRGVVLKADGKDRADNLRVRVWNADTEKVVYRTRTDEDGVFEIPRLDEGNHYVTIGPVTLNMRVLSARAGVRPQPHGVVLVVPKRMPIGPILLPGAAAALPQIVSP